MIPCKKNLVHSLRIIVREGEGGREREKERGRERRREGGNKIPQKKLLLN